MKRTILFINSGSKIKEFTLRKAKEMNLNLALVNNCLTWEKPYVDYFIQANTYNHEEVLVKVKEFAKNHKIDGVVTFWERDVILTAKVAEMLKLPGTPVKSAELARNKLLMVKAFHENNVPCPKFYPVNSFEDLIEGLEKIGVPAILKPVSGAASKNVVKIESKDNKYLKELWSLLYKFTQPEHDPIFFYNPGQFLLEEYLDGPEVSVEGVVDNEEVHLVSITDKLPLNGPYFVERGNVLPSLHSEETQKKIYEVAKAAIESLGLKNCGIHAEIRITKDGPKMVEIAARLGGDYICEFTETVYGVDLVKEVIKIALGEKPEIKKSKPKFYLEARYILPQKTGVVKCFKNIEDVLKMEGVYKVYIFVEPGQKVRTPPEGYDYLGWVITKGSSFKEVDELALKALEKIFVEII
jgi:biotin carboxylase